MLNMDAVKEASAVLESLVVCTPLIEANLDLPNQKIYLKCENLQKTGSFKIRGAAYFMSQLDEATRAKGVVAWSAGNHAQGVAKAAQMLGIKADIFIPSSGSLTKIEKTRNYGASVHLSNGLLDVAHLDALAFQAETDAVAIPPYDHEDIILGQATLGVELFDQLPHLDAVVIPIGGGGLIGGVAYAIKQLKPSCKVYGVEAAGAASTIASLLQNESVSITDVDTIADGIAVKSPGLLNFHLIQEYVDHVVSVTDDETSEAILELLEHNHLVVEGAGAVAYAAIKSGRIPVHANTVCMVSGGNLDINLLNKIIKKALKTQHRILELKVEIEDKPGSLLQIMEIIADNEGNILRVEHEHTDRDLPIKNCVIKIQFEMRSLMHLIEMENTLNERYPQYTIK